MLKIKLEKYKNISNIKTTDNAEKFADFTQTNSGKIL